MSLTVDLAVPERQVDVTFAVGAGETVAILGPNGSGKSSVLAAVAGLIRPSSGELAIEGTPVAGRRVWVPPHRRGVALLHQDPLLFPHLDVRANVAYGPRSHGTSAVEARRRADHWLAEVGAAAWADRRPRELSAGQAQRVAIARALATEPRVLLLDEPMAALDVDAVPAIRRLLRRVLAGRTTLMVTHDMLDALVLADRVVLIDGGRVVDDGEPDRVLARPRSDFGARLAGVNLVVGRAVDEVTVEDSTGRRLTGLVNEPLIPGDEAMAVFAPQSVTVHLSRPGGSARNVLTATVDHLEPRGGVTRVLADGLLIDVTTASAAALRLEPGTEVHLSVKATEVRTYPG